jgi:hypothetical protein
MRRLRVVVAAADAGPQAAAPTLLAMTTDPSVTLSPLFPLCCTSSSIKTRTRRECCAHALVLVPFPYPRLPPTASAVFPSPLHFRASRPLHPATRSRRSSPHTQQACTPSPPSRSSPPPCPPCPCGAVPRRPRPTRRRSRSSRRASACPRRSRLPVRRTLPRAHGCMY